MIRFVAAACVSPDMLYVAAALYDDPEDPFTELTRAFIYNSATSEKWFFHDVLAEVASVAIIPARAIRPRYACALADTSIEFYNSNERFVEHVVAPNIDCSIVRMRYLSDEKLYVCGARGQVFARTDTSGWHSDCSGIGKPLRVRGDAQTSVELDYRISVVSDPSNADSYAKIAEVMSVNQPAIRDITMSLDGVLYCVGMDGFIAFRAAEQRAWTVVETGIDERLLAVCPGIEPSTVVAVGYNGTVLVGSRSKRFINCSAIEDNQYFHSVTTMNNQLLLASESGLWGLSEGSLSQIQTRTRLDNFGTECIHIEAISGACWAIASDSVFRFDGSHWTEVAHPDIPLGGYAKVR